MRIAQRGSKVRRGNRLASTPAPARPRRGAMATLAAFAQARRGSVLIEWGLVAPVLIMLVLVVIELSMITFINATVEGGLKDASRWAITGQPPPAGMTKEQYIQQLILNHTYGLVPSSDITITTKVYPSFSDVGKGEPFNDLNANNKYDVGEPYTDVNKNGQWDKDMGVDGVGNGGDIVAYNVVFKWTVLSPLLQPFAEKDGKFTYTAAVVVRNEPF